MYAGTFNMKKIIFLLIIILFTTGSTYAQVLISADLRQDGKFNNTTGIYEPVSKDKAELSYFEFDKDFTLCRHMTPDKTSLYRIRSTKKDELNGRWEFDVVSNAGYSYYLILDIVNNNIRFIYKEKGTTYLAQFNINKFWVDK